MHEPGCPTLAIRRGGFFVASFLSLNFAPKADVILSERAPQAHSSGSPTTGLRRWGGDLGVVSEESASRSLGISCPELQTQGSGVGKHAAVGSLPKRSLRSLFGCAVTFCFTDLPESVKQLKRDRVVGKTVTTQTARVRVHFANTCLSSLRTHPAGAVTPAPVHCSKR
jgi:hypothetical protein